jgi:hypothetical protein
MLQNREKAWFQPGLPLEPAELVAPRPRPPLPARVPPLPACISPPLPDCPPCASVPPLPITPPDAAALPPALVTPSEPRMPPVTSEFEFTLSLRERVGVRVHHRTWIVAQTWVTPLAAFHFNVRPEPSA